MRVKRGTGESDVWHGEATRSSSGIVEREGRRCEHHGVVVWWTGLRDGARLAPDCGATDAGLARVHGMEPGRMGGRQGYVHPACCRLQSIVGFPSLDCVPRDHLTVYQARQRELGKEKGARGRRSNRRR